jgi:hypothetical protein
MIEVWTRDSCLTLTKKKGQKGPDKWVRKGASNWAKKNMVL